MLTGFTVHRSFYQNKIIVNHDVLDRMSCEILYYLLSIPTVPFFTQIV